MIDRFQTQKTGALLAYLAVQGGKPVSREQLAEILWPDGDPIAIRNRLNQAISSLRRQLHVPELGGALVILADHHALSINMQVVETDVDRFQRLVRQAESGSKAERPKVLREAAELYGGEFLAGYYEDWAQAQRLHLNDLYVRVLDYLIRSYSKSGQPDEAIEYAVRRLQLDRQDLRTHLDLMDLYLRADRPGSALRQSEELERMLAQEGEAMPDEALKLKARAERASKSPNLQRLPRGASSPEDGPSERKTVPEPSARLRPLPNPPNAFVGREVELQFLADKVQSGTRLITLVGIGGSGKTRTALESARQLSPLFEGRVSFVPFAHSESAETFLSDLGDALGFPSGDALAALSSMGPTLLVFDNLEHLDIGQSIAELMEACPECTILATSRRPLQLAAEMIYAVPPLPLPQISPATTLADIAQNPSIKLFVNRAQIARPDFQLTDRTAQSIIALCQRLEGLPLALELAAGWARALTPSQMLEQVSQRYDQLASRRRDILPRHRSMRAALEGSYWLLEREDQELFCRLGIIEGAFSREEIAAVTQSPVDHALAELLELGLLVREGDDRFRMFDTLRAFSRDHCSKALEHDTRWKLVDHCLTILKRDLPIAEWADEIDPIYPTFLASIRFAYAEGDQTTAASIAGYLAQFWEARSRIEEAEHVLNEIDAEHSPSGCLVGAYALFEWLSGRFERASELAKRAVDLLVTEGPSDALCRARRVLALESHRAGRYQEAITTLELICRDARNRGRMSLLSQSQRAIGNAHVELGDHVRARESYLDAVESAQAINDADEQGSSLMNLANLALLEGQTESAEEWIARAEDKIVTANHVRHLASLYGIKARVLSHAGKYPRAIEAAAKSIDLSPNDPLMRWRAYREMMIALMRNQDFENAARIAGFLDRFLANLKSAFVGIEFTETEELERELEATVGPPRYAQLHAVGESLSSSEVVEVAMRALDSPTH